MKDGALSHYYWSPGRLDYAKSCSAQNAPGAGNPTRKESFLQLSHRSRALALCPLWRQCREKSRFARQQKTHTVSLSRLSDAAIPPHSKVSDNPACTRASLLFWNTPLQPRALNRGRRLFLGRTKKQKFYSQIGKSCNWCKTSASIATQYCTDRRAAVLCRRAARRTSRGRETDPARRGPFSRGDTHSQSTKPDASPRPLTPPPRAGPGNRPRSGFSH